MPCCLGGVDSALAQERTLWQAALQAYPSGIAVVLLALLSIGLAQAVYLRRSNRLLRELTRTNHEAQASLQLAAAAFHSEVGMVVTDGVTRIQRANAAMASLFGYTQEELTGQATRLLRSATVAAGTMRAVWETVRTDGRWQGELLCRHREGHDVPSVLPTGGGSD